MLPRTPMLAKKNPAWLRGNFFLALALLLLLTSCAPPGPRALLKGRRLLEREDYAAAVEELRLATSLLSSNAQAWNYLGVAYHHLGQVTNAVQAYQRALFYDHNLPEPHFNLGCLWLEQNRPDRARGELTTYTQLRVNSAEAWLKLGTACLRTRDPATATNSFNVALRLTGQNPEALNGLGLAYLQRNRAREAAQYFQAALKQSPNYRPALLNLAVVSQQYLNDPAAALRAYRQYLALSPRAVDWNSVNSVAQGLERQLAPPPRSSPTNVAMPAPANSNAAKAPLAAVVKTNTTREPEPVVSAVTAPPANVPPPTPKVEVVHVPPEPIIKSAPDGVVPTAAPPAIVPAPPPVAASTTTVGPSTNAPAAPVVAAAPRPQKRSFFQRLNPLNLLRRDTKAAPGPTPLPPTGANSQAAPVAAAAPAAAVIASATRMAEPAGEGAAPVAWSRYSYHSPPTSAPGDRTAAVAAFAQGAQAQREHRLAQAAQAFTQATQLDPSYFEAQFYLAWVLYEQKSYEASLAAYENALALQPDSVAARYSFALALKAAHYPLDAANELEKVLVSNPKETRAHLALANLCAEQLRDPARARQHYLKVLELDPHHPQASDIRFWLAANPG